MDEPKFYRDPKIQAILVVLITALLYLFTLGRQGAAREVLLSGEICYVSASNEGGIRVLSLQNPANPVEVGFFDTPGSARKLDLEGSLLYVADGARGLRILNVLDPEMPVEVGALEIPGETLDVSVQGRYAYLAMGESGVTVVDISDPASPVFVHSMDTPGNAQALEASDVIIQGSGDEAGIQTPVTFVYVADGDVGLEIYIFLNPRQPAPLGLYDTPGNARDVSLAGHYAFVADGRRGVLVVDVANPASPVPVSAYDQDLTVISLNIVGNYLLLAEGEQGFTVLDMADPLAPLRLFQLDTPGEVQAVAATASLVYVADGSQGLRVYNLNAPGGPRQVGYYEPPGEATLGQILGSILAIGRGQMATIPIKVWRTGLLIVFDLLLFFVILYLWLAFFSQFVLPVRGLAERGQVINRLLLYLTGAHGPAIWIYDGKVRRRKDENLRRGPGVALFDTASAGVFRNSHIFTKVAGPGVVFTDGSEYLAGTVDLHRQAAGIGPSDGEDPYAPQREGESNQEYAERLDRRYETSGLTLDGVEVVPNISVFFGLDSKPGHGRTQFGFNPESVRRAIAGESINPDAAGPAEKHVSWTWLPVRIAADLWREYLRKFPLDELFTFAGSSDPSPSPEERKTAFDRIIEMMKKRMQLAEIEELDENGQPTGEKKPSLEYAILEEHGIKVLAVGVRTPRFPGVVENKLIEKWQATWLQRAQKEAREIDLLQAETKTSGQRLGLKEFAIAASLHLGRRLYQQPPSSHPPLGWRDTLESLVEGTLRLVNQEANLQPKLTNQRSMLVEIIEWLRKRAE